MAAPLPRQPRRDTPRPFAAALTLALTLALSLTLPLTAAPLDPAFFENNIRPLLQKHCVECHGDKKQKGSLRLDLKPLALKGGENGAAILPGQSAKSPLLARVLSSDADEQMPPKGDRLSPAETGLLRQWIDAGAPWPESDADRAASVDQRLLHWSFQPLKPQPHQASVDSFIVEKLNANGLALSPEADRRTLIRRTHLDVLGLPPTPQEIDAFVADPDPAAYEKLVEQLLESPHFGERWARHWLDVTRFAESHGFEMNQTRKNAWPYRDYVIRAFNQDLPFNQFIHEQIAGDASGEDAATGFLVGGPMDQVKSKDPVLTANQRADELHDMVSTTSAVFLGLTVNCARCHDHKFDPITANDYYALTALLQGVRHGERPLRSAEVLENQERAKQLRAQLRPLEEKLAAVRTKARNASIQLLDESTPPANATKPGTLDLKKPANAKPVDYSPGLEKGQAGDLGDISRLPTLGDGYKYWNSTANQPEDLLLWQPRAKGEFRLWVSWGAWTTHTQDARYLLDLDGDLTTRDDQTELLSINQRQFADQSPAIPSQRRWSGFKAVPKPITLHEQSVLLLRSGQSGGPVATDLIALERIVPNETAAAHPRLRAPIRGAENEDAFAPVDARFVRFTIHTASGSEPCLDELEVFTADPSPKNVALASAGAKVSVSSTFRGGSNPKHQARHLNDGKYGNDFSWISDESGRGWVQIELAKTERISRVAWSRDRSGSSRAFTDRLPQAYTLEVSTDGSHWTPVASAVDRLPQTFASRIATLPTLSEVPANTSSDIAKTIAERTRLSAEIQRLSETPKVYAGTFEQPGPTKRNHRGDPTQPREIIAPGVLSLIGKPIPIAPDAPEQQRRLALANWIASPENPLTARVIANRLWHYHFGTGIVDTPSDFGINGAKPSHPELLDWLASELISNSWSLKHLHRLILLSKTYRQSSAYVANAAAIDSSSRLLWRFPPRRMEAEAIRDSILSITGKLNRSMGGPGFDLFEPNDNYVKVYKSKRTFNDGDFRRMVYQSKPRMALDDFFGAFDCPDAGQPAPKRTASTTPLQALNLLNDPFALQQAGFLAERIQSEVGPDPSAQTRRAFRLVYGREPAPQELRDSTDLIQTEGLPILTRALLNSNEFLRID